MCLILYQASCCSVPNTNFKLFSCLLFSFAFSFVNLLSLLSIHMCSQEFRSLYVKDGTPWWLSGKESTCSTTGLIRLLGLMRVRKIPLEEGMATPSSTLAWRVPWTEEPGGLQPMGSQSVGLD